MNRQQYEQAKEAGRSARSEGRRRDSCPVYALGAEGAMLREAWQSEWDKTDAEIKGSRK